MTSELIAEIRGKQQAARAELIALAADSIESGGGDAGKLDEARTAAGESVDGLAELLGTLTQRRDAELAAEKAGDAWSSKEQERLKAASRKMAETIAQAEEAALAAKQKVRDLYAESSELVSQRSRLQQAAESTARHREGIFAESGGGVGWRDLNGGWPEVGDDEFSG